MSANYSLFKCVFVGAVDGGKTALTQMFCNNTVVENYEPTIGVDFQIKTQQYHGLTIKLQIWDVSGQDRFRAIVPSYLRAAHMTLIVFDVTSRVSFDTVQIKLQQIQQYAPLNCIKILIANKIDLEQQRIISSQQGYELAQRLNLHYFETTSRQPEYIENVFNFFFNNEINLNKLIDKKQQDIQFSQEQRENNYLKQQLLYYQDFALILSIVIALCTLILYFIAIISNLLEVVQQYKIPFFCISFCLASIILYHLIKTRFIQR